MKEVETGLPPMTWNDRERMRQANPGCTLPPVPGTH
jgi:hypothetical protein